MSISLSLSLACMHECLFDEWRKFIWRWKIYKFFTSASLAHVRASGSKKLLRLLIHSNLQAVLPHSLILSLSPGKRKTFYAFSTLKLNHAIIIISTSESVYFQRHGSVIQLCVWYASERESKFPPPCVPPISLRVMLLQPLCCCLLEM